MLVDRQQLEMGEPHVDGVGHQAVGKLVIGEEAVALAAGPGAEMHLEDADRRRRPPGAAPRRCEPSRIAPGEVVDAANHGRVLRPQLAAGADRVRLQGQERAVGGTQLELVDRPLAEPGDEDLPDPHAATAPHRVAAAVPAIEVADHRDASRVRRPDGEVHARGAGMLDRVGAQPLPQPAMGALADEIVVHLAQDRREAIGVVHLPRAAIIVGAQGVAEPHRPIR